MGHLNNAIYQQYCQQVAIDAAADAGYDMSWHDTRGAAWVVRQISVEYLRPAVAGDVLDITTWISGWRGVRARREYEMRRQADGEPIARASAEWVYLDRETGRPRRIPKEMAASIGTAGETVVKPSRLPAQGLDAGSFRWRHQVKRYEIDAMQHVNNAVYLNWVEEAKFRAAEAVGWPVERMRAENFVTVQIRHDTEYFLPAVYGDEIEVVSRLFDLRRVRGSWLHEIYRMGSSELLVRNYSTGAFLDLEGRPAPAPQAMLDALLQGEDRG
jgi:acyl-CoA thioester hydrolase